MMNPAKAVSACLGAAACLAVSASSFAAITAPVYIDFGAGDGNGNGDLGLRTTGAPVPNTWNSVGFNAGSSSDTVALLDKDGNATGATVTITDGFNWYNAAGSPAGTSGDAAEFWQGGNDSLYIQVGGDDSAAFELTGLDAGVIYTLTYFASRDPAGDNRSGQLRATGASVVTSAELDAANNATEVVSFDVAADLTGKISVELLRGPSSTSDFTYLNALKVEAIPEPASLALLGLGGLCLIARRR